MTRTFAALLVLALASIGCGSPAASMDAGPHDAGPVIDSGPCAQGNSCGPTPLPSQCTSSEDAGCTIDFGCRCETLADGTCVWNILPECVDAGAASDAGPAERG